ncbi:MAG: transposase [Planctomycetaceae bacterium]|nr:transposase [Planctomycetaceae bacterium]MCB9953894.1 transposase [Planctomycetaceae bacterium]
MNGHRKQVKHFHEPGDLHELTFSCYQRRPLLTIDLWRKMFCQAIDAAIERHEFRLVAFVIMPEHVHLLVHPTTTNPDVSGLLSAIKRPFSFRIKQLLIEQNSTLLPKLMVRERPGKTSFRFWQEGPGYDRNLHTQTAVLAAIDYIHNNPVARKLVDQARDWKWSSYRWYEWDKQNVDPDLPTIHGLPWDFFTG